MSRHTLVVTSDYDDTDERDFRIECAGVTDYCTVWTACSCKEAAGFDSAESVGFAHGDEHKLVEQQWAVRPHPPRCIYGEPFADDLLPDRAVDLDIDGIRLTAGRYPVELTWLGDGDFAIDLIEEGPDEAP